MIGSQRSAEDSDLAAALDVLLSIVFLFNLAIAQPLLELLGRNVEFFLARGSGTSEIVLVGSLLTLGLPLLLGCSIAQVRIFHAHGGRLLHGVAFWLLATALALGVLKRVVTGASGWVLVLVGAGLGGGLLLLFDRNHSFRSLFRWTAPLPFVVAGLFLFASPAAALLSTGRVPVADVTLDDPAPVVMVVFDELPLASLMDRGGGIDGGLFPNIERLADDAIWFRNATTVSARTDTAVPAILDGKYPEEDRLPIASEDPHNVFTLVGGEMEVHARELVTRLCPPVVCREPHRRGPRSARWTRMTSDLSIISAHALLPEDLTRALPPIDESWADFAAQERPPGARMLVGHGSPPRRFLDLVAAMRPSPDPVFYFAHVMLPHVPWRYLPSGQEYPQTLPVPGTARIPGKVGLRWTDDEWLVTQGYQRHLLQTGLVDRLVGELIDRLKQIGLYERALVVVASDHGTSFVPGEPRRTATLETVGGVAAVPLFVKRPFQRGGRIDDSPIRTIDVLPTIADELGASMPWRDIDGTSAFARTNEEPRHLTLEAGQQKVTFPATGEHKYRVVRDKFRLFGSLGGSIDPFRTGPSATRTLVWRAVADLPVGPAAGAAAVISDLEAYRAAQPDDNPFPALLEGELDPSDPSAPPAVAVVLNGTIAAVTRPGIGTRSFYAMLPRRVFREGRNEIAFYVVERSAEGFVMRPLGVRDDE